MNAKLPPSITEETVQDEAVRNTAPIALVPSRKTVGGLSTDYYSKSTAFMLADLAKSGLVPEDMDCTAHVNNMGSSADMRQFIAASYQIPFYDMDGAKLVAMWRQRRELLPSAEKLKKLGKYTQPHLTMADGCGHYPYLPPAIWKMDHDGTVHLCEGEKKAAALIKFAEVIAIGLTGKDAGVETVRVLAEVIRKLGNVTRICVWPDADVRRFDVIRSYGRLRARLLENLWDVPGLTIDVMQPSWDARKFKGIDDALGGGWQFAIGEVVGEELPIEIRALADRIGLDYTVSDKGVMTLTLNEDNICRTLEDREMWGAYHLNVDNGRWLNGPESCDPANETYLATRRLQRVFGMKKVGEQLVSGALNHICKLSPVSPWVDYLSSLEWDGVPRLGGWLTLACGARDKDIKFLKEVGVKFLVGAVARAFAPGTAFDWMLILAGPQGCGKSSLPKALMPPKFADNVMLAPESHDKDLQQAAGMCRVLMFDEMSVFFSRKADTTFIKQFVTAPEDVYRPPYARATDRIARRCILYGSTNFPEDILKADSSGYRRWVIIPVEGVVETQFGKQFDWKWLEAWREQLWAEAVDVYRSGQLDYSQVDGASAQAAGHVSRSTMHINLMTLLMNMKKRGEIKQRNVRLNPKDTTAEKVLIWTVDVSEFLIRCAGLGRQPTEAELTNFWSVLKSPTPRKSNGGYYRVLSDEIYAELDGSDDE